MAALTTKTGTPVAAGASVSMNNADINSLLGGIVDRKKWYWYDTLKLQPELSLNDLGYFSIDAETAIDGELRRRDIEQIQRKGK